MTARLFLNTIRMRLLIQDLDGRAYRAPPKGVGRKTINQATEAGFIESATRARSKVHRLTKRGLRFRAEIEAEGWRRHDKLADSED